MFEETFNHEKDKDHNYSFLICGNHDVLCDLMDEVLDLVNFDDRLKASMILSSFIGMIIYLYERYDSIEYEYEKIKRKLEELEGQ